MTNNVKEFLSTYFKNLYDASSKLDTVDFLAFIEYVENVVKHSKKIIIVGNGGSSAIASHVAVDITKTNKIRAINFNEADLITCFANDYGYSQWVSEALIAYADEKDLGIFISSSGRSDNIINGAKTAKSLGLNVITLTGFDENNPLKELGDINLWVDSKSYNLVETTHQAWLLSIVDYFALHKRV